MLKGVQKNMMFIQLPAASYFEGAYFIMRTGKKEPKQGEMIKEANKIIADAGAADRKKTGSRGALGREKVLFFVYGCVTGSLAVAAAWLLTLFLF